MIMALIHLLKGSIEPEHLERIVKVAATRDMVEDQMLAKMSGAFIVEMYSLGSVITESPKGYPEVLEGLDQSRRLLNGLRDLDGYKEFLPIAAETYGAIGVGYLDYVESINVAVGKLLEILVVEGDDAVLN